MAVTKQIYTLSSTWTASGLAGLFRSAFINAGLMTEWYDDFVNGTVQNRILEVVNDGTKTYGKVYYWFMFTTTSVSVHTALSWDTDTNLPTGTIYQDYYSATTNATTNHVSLLSGLATTTSLTLTRYTSATNASCTWFVLRQASSIQFLIPFGSYTATSFVNQNITAFNGMISPVPFSSSYFGLLSFSHTAGSLRRTFLGASSSNGGTGNSTYSAKLLLIRYAAMGNVSGAGTSNFEASYQATWIPSAQTNTHTGLAANYSPVFTSVLCSPYLPPLPAEFGLATYYASTSVALGDTFIVNAGVEEYEVISLSVPTLTNAGAGSLLLLARTVG